MTVPFLHLPGTGAPATRDDDLLLQVDGTDRASRPMPLHTTVQRLALAGVEKGDWDFDSTLNAPAFHNGTAWEIVSGSGGSTPFTGNVTITKADPAVIFNTATASDTDFWLGVTEDAGGDNDDFLQIGVGTTPGTGAVFSLNKDGYLGLAGTAAGANTVISASPVGTLTAGTVSGLDLFVFNNPAGASSANITGMSVAGISQPANAQNHTGAIRGVVATGSHRGTATASLVIGLDFQATNTSTGTITSAMGARIAVTNSGGGAITSSAGVVVLAHTVATNNTYLLLGTGTQPSGNYGIYSTSANENSIGADADVSTILGRTRIDSRVSDTAYFSHYDNSGGASYALAQGASGSTSVNAASGGTVVLRVNNSAVLTIAAALVTSAQDFRLALTKGIQIAEGSNASSGQATLVGGTVVVSTTKVTASSRIQLTTNVVGGTAGFLVVSARTAGVSFTILSSNGADTSQVAWVIIEP